MRKRKNKKIVSFEKYVKSKERKALLKAWKPDKEDIMFLTEGVLFAGILYGYYILFVMLASIIGM